MQLNPATSIAAAAQMGVSNRALTFIWWALIVLSGLLFVPVVWLTIAMIFLLARDYETSAPGP
jgi:hypothetical protein